MLTEQSYAEFSRVLANFAGSHFTFVKYILPAMRQSHTSSMLFVTGGVGELGSPGAGAATGAGQGAGGQDAGSLLALRYFRACISSPSPTRCSLATCPSPTCPHPAECPRPCPHARAGKRVLSADSGLATVGGAALYGIVRAAQAQYQGRPPRINELRIFALVTRHGGARLGWAGLRVVCVVDGTLQHIRCLEAALGPRLGPD